MRKFQIYGTIFAVALALILAESAILRPYRRLNSLLDSEDFSKERTQGSWRNKDLHIYKPRHFSGSFRPSPRRCCQIGERVAQKRMSCDITVLAMLRKYHNNLWLSSQLNSDPSFKDRSNYGFHSRLSEKVAKCSAIHPRQFVKCCESEERYAIYMRRCQLTTGSREERRRCRHAYRHRNRRK
ncbi:hypothetical protein PoB_004254400 [Plakobranchus ocellatus]|uniref:Uncharacterized protein n=1 Tax=Plakobranchus ocellatus TaxID=259542 RepID=A0AAV4B7L2_9GAST|nr:hypothetical protein PoB_004254400 [Plakobranchus ocellatus]